MKRALAIFAKTPIPGRVKTRLCPPLSPRQCADLYRCMLLDTLGRVASLGYHIVVFYEGDEPFFRTAAPGATLIRQQQGTLGVRLEHAFDEMAALGYRARVVMGTDGPDLPLQRIPEAFDLLERGSDLVFGPAEDGGYYLVGLSGGYGTIFQEIPWSGPKVLETSLAQAKRSGLSVSLLPSWYDVDSYQDLIRPGLTDPDNGAPLTRAFLAKLQESEPASEAV